MTDQKDDDVTLAFPGLDDDELLSQVPAEAPSEGFADRVMTAWSAEQQEALESSTPASGPSRADAPRSRAFFVAIASAAAAVLMMTMVQGWPSAPAGGSHVATTRTELSLGGRAVAVVESGADVSWRVRRGGDAVVEQRRGEVFYRVERGGAFVVKTPAGEARVTGTSFSLEVNEMATEGMTKRGTVLAGAAAGAAMTAALLLTVYEGSVVLAGNGGEVAVSAGEAAKLGPDGVPSRLEGAGNRHAEAFRDELLRAERQALKEKVTDLEGRLKEVMVARSRGEDPLAVEARACQEKLSALERELDVEQQIRSQLEGEPVPFPDDLSERYRQDALKSAFLDIFARSGLDGDVVALDCNEYPCVVYGEYGVPGGEADDMDAAFRKLEGMLHEAYPPSGNNHSIRSTTHRDAETGEAKTMFGISVLPKEGAPEGDIRKNMNRRLQHRNQQFFEATWGQR